MERTRETTIVEGGAGGEGGRGGQGLFGLSLTPSNIHPSPISLQGSDLAEVHYVKVAKYDPLNHARSPQRDLENFFFDQKAL